MLQGFRMMKKVILIISLLLLITAGLAGGSQPRPFAGIGILIVRHMNPAHSPSPPSITLYREPGLGRICDLPVSELPLLTHVVNLPPCEFALAVMGKKGDWMLVAYDDVG